MNPPEVMKYLNKENICSMKVIAIIHPKILKSMKKLGLCTKGFIPAKKLPVDNLREGN